MFCSKCGKKIGDKVKFCPKCGSASAKATADKPEEKEPIKIEVSAVKEPPPKSGCSGCCSLFLIALIIGALVPFFTGNSAIWQSQDFVFGLTWALIIGGLALVIYLVRHWLKLFHSSPIVAGIVLIIGAIMLTSIYYHIQNKQVAAVSAFQDSLADALTAQFMGDDIVAGKSGDSFSAVQNATKTAASNLSKITLPSSLADYQKSITEWAKKLDVAAKSQKSWPSRPDVPTDFKDSLNGALAEKIFADILNNIAATKDYGDWAIAKSDRGAMRAIAGLLKADDIFLADLSTDIARANDTGNSSVAYARVISTKRAPRRRCNEAGCWSNLRQRIPPTYSSAHNYSVGEPSAVKDWDDAWKSLVEVIKIDDGYSLGGMGIIVDGQATTEISPMQQAFNDECRAKGGTPGGTGGTKTRLPQTLSHGYNCDYKDSGHACWDYLTTTGRRFRGGENGCPEQNLLPRPAPTYNNPFKSSDNTSGGKTTGGGGSKNNGGTSGGTSGNTSGSEKTGSWDGIYSVNIGQGKCDAQWTGPLAGQNMPAPDFSDLASPSTGSIGVRGGAVVGGTAIDAAGDATGGLDLSTSYGEVSGQVVGSGTFHFTRSENGVPQVSGTFTVDEVVTGITAHCVQPYSGSRTGN